MNDNVIELNAFVSQPGVYEEIFEDVRKLVDSYDGDDWDGWAEAFVEELLEIIEEAYSDD